MSDLKIEVVPKEFYWHEVRYVQALEQKAQERDELIRHLRAVITAVLQLIKNAGSDPVLTDASAYLTKIMPPEDKQP